MKVKNTTLALICIFLCACEGEKIDSDKGGRALQLQAEIDGMKTRATDASWEKDDAIGIYMAKSGQALNASALRQNVKYVTTGTSAFKPVKESEEIILPFDGSNVDFISYYPYRENITDFTYPVDVSNQSVQSAIDLMYANNAKNINSKNPNVHIQFAHQLSKIILNIGHDASIDLSDLTVLLTNVTTHGSFNLANGTLTPSAERETIQLKMSNKGAFAEAILLPQANLSGMTLWFIVDEEETEVYTFNLSNALTIGSFEKSTKYTYNVDLFSENITAITESDVKNWTQGPIANVTATLTDKTPPIVKGSKKNPYTVAEAMSNLGASGWVEGYIVGAFKSSTMNSFSPDPSDASTSNLALADSKNETNISHIIPVQLPTGKIRDALNLSTNPANLNKKVMIKGNLGSYFSVTGVRDLTDYSLTE